MCYDKTLDNHYLILTLAAIARELEAMYGNVLENPAVKHIRLALGLPPSHHGALKEKYKSFFMNGGEPYHFEYNQKAYVITVDAVDVWVQGFAAAVGSSEYAEIKDHALAYVVDIGGYTTDVIKMNSGKVDMHFCESLDMGVIHLYGAVQSAVMAMHQVEIDSLLIEAILAGRYKDKPEIVKTAKEAAQAYIDELVRKLAEKKINFTLGYFVFIGGGAQLFKPALRKALSNTSSVFVADVSATNSFTKEL